MEQDGATFTIEAYAFRHAPAKSDKSRIVRHEILSLSTGLLRALDIAVVPIAGLISYIARYQSVAVELRHGLILALGMAVVANVMVVITPMTWPICGSGGHKRSR